MNKKLKDHEAVQHLKNQGIPSTCATLARLRRQGKGPKFIRAGASFVYDPIDLDAWIESLKIQPADYKKELDAKPKRKPRKKKQTENTTTNPENHTQTQPPTPGRPQELRR
jgi:hypothetical protein